VLTEPVLAAVGPDDPDVTVERVADQTRMGEFERVHFAGWGLRPPDPEDPDNSIRNWAAEPNWRVYLARYRGTPAGTAILYLSPDIAYLASATTHPEWRGRGVQNALLRHRIADAARAGARIVFGQAEYQSTSYRNMLRTNIPLLYNQSLWTRVE
jgi:GNAT superfamily N-acetyltransferase